MWCEKNLLDVDADNIPEVVCAYYWHGEIYIGILKYYDNTWHVLNTVKGKGTGGCSSAIFKQENGEYRLLSRFSLVNNPIIISNKKTKGYKDIIMYVSGGGIESFFAQIKYDGTTYPSNPSIEPKINVGTKLEGIAIIADDITKNSGIELKFY